MTERRWRGESAGLTRLLADPDPHGVDWLPLRLRLVVQLYGRAADVALRRVGVTLSQYLVLDAVERNPGASGAELAAFTTQTPQSLSGATAGLVRDGLLERSPGEGRRVRHALSPDGEALVARSRAALESLDQKLFAEIDEARLRAAVELSDDLMARLLDLDDEPAGGATP
ncbi:MarR family winged helix-turn-helix transcriptional regulator [Nocardioides pacificus]